MKILSTSISIPCNDAQWWRIFNIAKMLENNGHEIHFIHYCRRSSYIKLTKKKRTKEKYSNQKFLVTSTKGVHLQHLKQLAKEEYDLVYANNYYACFCSLLGKLTKVPLVFDIHGDLVGELLLKRRFESSFLNSKNFLRYISYKMMDLANLHLSNKIICPSYKMIKYLHFNKKIPLKKMSYVPNGVDLDFFKSNSSEKLSRLKNQLNLDDKLIFGYIGGFHPYQGVENFLNVAKRTEEDGIAFLIVGGNKRTSNGNVIQIPYMERKKVLDYYSICDVLVLPRPSCIVTDIAAPTKFSEYTAMGKPVLATNVGDAANLVKKYDCGILIENNQPKNIINGINKFRELEIEEIHKMGKKSRKLAENEFDLKIVSKNLLNTLEEFQ